MKATKITLDYVAPEPQCDTGRSGQVFVAVCCSVISAIIVFLGVNAYASIGGAEVFIISVIPAMVLDFLGLIFAAFGPRLHSRGMLWLALFSLVPALMIDCSFAALDISAKVTEPAKIFRMHLADPVPQSVSELATVPPGSCRVFGIAIKFVISKRDLQGILSKGKFLQVGRESSTDPDGFGGQHWPGIEATDELYAARDPSGFGTCTLWTNEEHTHGVLWYEDENDVREIAARQGCRPGAPLNPGADKVGADKVPGALRAN